MKKNYNILKLLFVFILGFVFNVISVNAFEDKKIFTLGSNVSLEAEEDATQVDKIFIKAPQKYIGESSSMFLEAIVLPLNSVNKNVVWSSSDTSIATIDSTTGGLTTKNKEGKVIITATATDGSGVYGTIELIVKNLYMKVNEQKTINSSTTYEDVIWEISDENILKKMRQGYSYLSPLGRYYHYIDVLALKEGSVTVQLKTISGQLLTQSSAVVFSPISEINSKDKKMELDLNERKTIELELNPENITESLDEVFYVSENEEIVTIDNAGNVVGKKVGSTNIVIYSKYYNKQLKIPVVVDIYPTDIILDKEEINLSKDNRSEKINYQFDKQDVTYTSVSFESSNPEIAIVDSNGNITALRNGSTFITVKLNNGKISKTINVNVSGFETNIANFDYNNVENYEYDGLAKTPLIIIYNKEIGENLTENIDYTLEYQNNINAGTAKIIIKGEGYYSGEYVITFEIKPLKIDYKYSDTTVEFNNKNHTINLIINTKDVTVNYSVDGGTSSTNMPVFKNPGKYQVSFDISKSNYESVNGFVTLIITQGTIKYDVKTYDRYSDNFYPSISYTDNERIKVDLSNNNFVNGYEIKYANEKGEYILTNPVISQNTGKYEIKYKISSQFYNSAIGSSFVNNYGISNVSNLITFRDAQITGNSHITKNRYLIVRNFDFNPYHLFNQFTLYDNLQNWGWKHYNDTMVKVLNKSENLKTGNYYQLTTGNDYGTHFWVIVVLGDVNRDGKISALDYVRIKNYIMSNWKSDNWLDWVDTEVASDVNEDGKISALDYVRIKNHIMNGGK